MIYQNDKNENTQNQFSKESMMSKTDAAVLLIQRALQSGIKADYLLMDTGLDVIGMVKQLKQRYISIRAKNIHFTN